MIKSIFYTRFHPSKGPSILHQVPDGSITQTQTQTPQADPTPPLIDFASISDLVIPRQEFCNRLVTICSGHYRILGFPICIENEAYNRNQFIFNLAIVLPREFAGFESYASVVRKLGGLLRNLEEQSGFLSAEEVGDDDDDLEGRKAGDVAKLYGICEVIMEDLNNYSEVQLPIDDATTINLKLFQSRPPPAPVYAWHVPVATVQLQKIPISSDLTMTRVIPHIDGIASVAQIAELADCDLGLTRKAVAHLLYYECVLLLDIWRFGAIYACTPAIREFVEDEAGQADCVRYVSVGSRLSRTKLSDEGTEVVESELQKTDLLKLFSSLKQGLSVKEWCDQHKDRLRGIDVRRLITFGVIKGFLYRVHKYAYVDRQVLAAAQVKEDQEINLNFQGPSSTGTRTPAGGITAQTMSRIQSRDERRGSTAPSTVIVEAPPLQLAKFLDGLHCFDEICTSLQVSEKRLEEAIRMQFPEAKFIHR